MKVPIEELAFVFANQAELIDGYTVDIEQVGSTIRAEFACENPFDMQMFVEYVVIGEVYTEQEYHEEVFYNRYEPEVTMFDKSGIEVMSVEFVYLGRGYDVTSSLAGYIEERINEEIVIG